MRLLISPIAAVVRAADPAVVEGIGSEPAEERIRAAAGSAAQGDGHDHLRGVQQVLTGSAGHGNAGHVRGGSGDRRPGDRPADGDDRAALSEFERVVAVSVKAMVSVLPKPELLTAKLPLDWVTPVPTASIGVIRTCTLGLLVLAQVMHRIPEECVCRAGRTGCQVAGPISARGRRGHLPRTAVHAVLNLNARRVRRRVGQSVTDRCVPAH